MNRKVNQQLALKPQDLAVLLKISLQAGLVRPYAVLAREMFMSASEVHASLSRALLARIVLRAEDGAITLVRPALLEFALHGAKYAFPPVIGPPARGLPTAYAGPGLREQLAVSEEDTPVWPTPKGRVRGMTLHPLYPNVPLAAMGDSDFYEVLSLFDALRIGAARERNLASAAITRKLA